MRRRLALYVITTVGNRGNRDVVRPGVGGEIGSEFGGLGVIIICIVQINYTQSTVLATDNGGVPVISSVSIRKGILSMIKHTK